MNIDEVLAFLKTRNEPVPRPLRLPTEQEVAQTESDLGFRFPPQYRKFQLEASNVTYGVLEPGLVLPDMPPYICLQGMAQAGWSLGVPRDRLPFCEDNGNYFTVNSEDKVGYFDHDGGTHWIRYAEFKDWVLNEWLEMEDTP